MTRQRNHVPIVLGLIVMIAVAGRALAATGPARLIGIAEIREGSLLFETSVPGRFISAPLVSTDIAIDIQGIAGRSIVRQRFLNATGHCVEGIYAFPLPEDAAVDRLRMIIGSRVIEGEIHERGEAKKIYDEAKSEGRRASLLEEHRPNLFTIAVANVAAGEEVEIEIELQQLVHYAGGRFTLRFPTVVGPRYQPRATGNAEGGTEVQPSADAAMSTTANDAMPPVEFPLPPEANPPLLPGGEIGNTVRLVVTLDSGVPLRRIESPTHEIESSTLGHDRYEIRLVEPSAPADRDFVLEWEPDLGREPTLAVFSEPVEIMTGKQAGESAVYSLLMVLPPEPDETFVRLPRETVFVIDTSGSMAGASLAQAKSALVSAIDRLGSQDRFNVIEFNSSADALFERGAPADPLNRAIAKDWVGGLASRGGTEMMRALELALDDSDPIGEEVRQVIFITDGLVGNEPELFHFIRRRLGRTRLFTVGIGSTPNSGFMTGAARFGRGTFTWIGHSEEVAEKMDELFARIERPVLTGLEAHFDDPGAEVWPARIPDLYAGEPLVLVAKTPSPLSTVSFKGSLGERMPWSDVRVLSSVDASPHTGIAKLWAERKIEGILDELVAGGEEASVRQRVLDVALAFHLVSPYTSLVAVDVTPAGVDPATCRSEPVPVNPPAGMEMVGSLPQTATPSALFVLLGLVFIGLGAAMRFGPRWVLASRSSRVR